MSYEVSMDLGAPKRESIIQESSLASSSNENEKITANEIAEETKSAAVVAPVHFEEVKVHPD